MLKNVDFSFRRFSLLLRSDLLRLWKWLLPLLLIYLLVIPLMQLMDHQTAIRILKSSLFLAIFPFIYLNRSLSKKYNMNHKLVISLLLPASKFEKFCSWFTIGFIFPLLLFGIIYIESFIIGFDMGALTGNFKMMIQMTLAFFFLSIVRNSYLKVPFAFIIFFMFFKVGGSLYLTAIATDILYFYPLDLLLLVGAWISFKNYNCLGYVKEY